MPPITKRMKGWFCFPSTQLKIHIEAGPDSFSILNSHSQAAPEQFHTELPLAPPREVREFLINVKQNLKKTITSN